MGKNSARTVVSIGDVALWNGLDVRFTPPGGDEVVVGRVVHATPCEDGSVQVLAHIEGLPSDGIQIPQSFSMSCALKGGYDA